MTIARDSSGQRSKLQTNKKQDTQEQLRTFKQTAHARACMQQVHVTPADKQANRIHARIHENNCTRHPRTIADKQTNRGQTNKRARVRVHADNCTRHSRTITDKRASCTRAHVHAHIWQTQTNRARTRIARDTRKHSRTNQPSLYARAST